MEKTQFDDIRPYNAEEIPAAMVRIANSSSFPLLASYVYPDAFGGGSQAYSRLQDRA